MYKKLLFCKKGKKKWKKSNEKNNKNKQKIYT